MENTVIHTRIEKIWLDEHGIIHFEYNLGAENKLEDAIESINVARKLYAEKKRPALIDIRNQYSITRESRAYYAGEETKKIFLAAELLIHSPISRVIGNFFIGLNKPLFPTKLFSSEKEAMEWLKSFIK